MSLPHLTGNIPRKGHARVELHAGTERTGEPATSMASCYERLDTPTARPRESAAKDGHQLILVNRFRPREGAAGQGFFHADRDDLKGFAMGWVLGAARIGSVWALLPW